jgi:chemotaxis protein MotB
MAGKGGGAWKVAYADFVTAMMAFFLVMWITAQSEQVKEAIAHHFNEPFDSSIPSEETGDNRGPGHHPPAIPSPDKKAKYRPAAPAPHDSGKQPEARRPRMLTIRPGEQTRTGTVVFFEENSAELDADGQQRLKRLVPWIAGKPQKVEIRGHASRRPMPDDSPFKDAWELSYARCLAVRKLLEKHGIAPQRIRMSQAGGHEPSVLEPEGEGRDPGARVEVYLLSELVQDFSQTDAKTDSAPAAGKDQVRPQTH